MNTHIIVIPAKAGIYRGALAPEKNNVFALIVISRQTALRWIPAFAGMTKL